MPCSSEWPIPAVLRSSDPATSSRMRSPPPQSPDFSPSSRTFRSIQAKRSLLSTIDGPSSSPSPPDASGGGVASRRISFSEFNRRRSLVDTAPGTASTPTSMATSPPPVGANGAFGADDGEAEDIARRGTDERRSRRLGGGVAPSTPGPAKGLKRSQSLNLTNVSDKRSEELDALQAAMAWGETRSPSPLPSSPTPALAILGADDLMAATEKALSSAMSAKDFKLLIRTYFYQMEVTCVRAACCEDALSTSFPFSLLLFSHLLIVGFTCRE